MVVFFRGLCAILLLTLSVNAAQFELVAWNVESGGTHRNTIGAQLREYEDVDLWVLSEVHAGNADFYVASTGAGESGSFEGLIGSTGGADRLVISYDAEQFDLVEGYELSDLAMGGGRAPLVAHLRMRADGQEFLLVANHLYRGDPQKRLAQAVGLREWAQSESLPIITAGDFNFDYDLPSGPGNPAFIEFGLAGVFKWEKPERLVETNWSDQNGDGENDYNSVLDFVWTAGGAQGWCLESEFVVVEGDFPDSHQTSDHRAVIARFDTVPGPLPLTLAEQSRPRLHIARPRTSRGNPRAFLRNETGRAFRRGSPGAHEESIDSGESGGLAFTASAARDDDFGRFVGEVVTRWRDDERNMELLEDFAYIDSKGRTWRAQKGSVVNGASIPSPFWSIVGSPYTGSYRRASVVHDVACDERSASWKEVHRMFYEACRCGGAGLAQAKVMYWAVYHHGPRWGEEVASMATPTQLSDSQLKAVEAFVKMRNPSLEELEQMPPVE